ncbi:MAG: tagatose 1,6-diphosphate aldolase [Chloroflexota bacterium]
MKNLSIGKLRGLQQIATAGGVMTMVALDHRGSLARMISPEHPEEVSYAQMVECKLELCDQLAPYASAVLLDPVFGVAPGISHGVLPNNTGLLVSLEASGYGDPQYRVTEQLKEWSVEKIKRVGASAVKLLLYYRPDLVELAEKQRDMVKDVAQECIKYDIPFLVEPVTYPIATEVTSPELLADTKSKLVIQTAQEITALPIDVLKAEFPGDLRYHEESELEKRCYQIDRYSAAPWVILSAGVDYQTFYRQVEIACKSGASGFLAGRAIWQEAVRMKEAQERKEFLSTVVVDRLKRLAELAVKYASPWYRKWRLNPQELVPVSEDWYKEY